MRVCNELEIPVVARGSGTSLVGGSVPLGGGIVVSLERMGAKAVDVVPVVSRANIQEMYGVLTLADILANYGVARDQAISA